MSGSKSARVLIAVVLAVVALVAPIAVAGAAPVGPTGGADAARWAASHDGPQPYAGVNVTWDVPIRMSDGTVLRANVYRPADVRERPTATKTPVIVNMTPYTKLITTVGSAVMQNPVLEPYLLQIARSINLSGTPIDGINDIAHTIRDGGAKTFLVDFDLVRSGYTQVVVDVRGTGFSQGVWDVFQSREQRDTIEVIDWASKQRWSNGKVGMSGVSYSAINQIQAANKNPKALKAIFPVEPGGDLIRDIVAPGGALGVGFLPLWLTLVNTTKMIPNVASMLNGTFDWKWLADRISDPFTFYPQLFAALLTPDIPSVPPNLKALLDNDSEPRSSWLDHADRITTPTLIYGGWFDLFTNSEVRMYNKIPLPPGQKQLIMGDGYHLTIGGGQEGRRNTPPRLDVLQKAWFDKWLKGIDNGVDSYGPVNLKQVGDSWITAQQFPRAGMERQRLYLGDRRSGTAAHAVRDGSLTPHPTRLACPDDHRARSGTDVFARRRATAGRRPRDLPLLRRRCPHLRARGVVVHHSPADDDAQRVRVLERATEHRARCHRRLLDGDAERRCPRRDVEGADLGSGDGVAARVRQGGLAVRAQR